MITVVIPAFNAHADLARALTSIRLQTFPDWQCIVVDDGSAQPLSPLVEAFGDPRIRVIRHAVNRGRGAARQTGLAAVTTPFVAWQDADDWSYPERLERQLRALQAEPRASFVSAAAAMVDLDERVIGLIGRDRPGVHRLGPRELPGVIHPTLLFRRSVLERGTYQSTFRTSEDHAFLMTALREFAFIELPEVLYAYREEQSRSLKKYYQSTLTRVRVAAALTRVRPLDRIALLASHVSKLAVVTGLEAVGRRSLLSRRAQTQAPAAVLAHHDVCRALVDLAMETAPASGAAPASGPAPSC